MKGSESPSPQPQKEKGMLKSALYKGAVQVLCTYPGTLEWCMSERQAERSMPFRPLNSGRDCPPKTATSTNHTVPCGGMWAGGEKNGRAS